MSDQKNEQAGQKQIPLTELVALFDKLKQTSEEDNNIQYDEDYIKQLKGAYSQFKEEPSFQVGQLVKWKKNLKNRKMPKENQPAIVLEVLEKPFLNQEVDMGSPYFREKIDLVLGLLDKSGNMFAFYYDSKRFEHFE